MMIEQHERPSFDEPRLVAAIESLPSEAIDDLPYGVIRLDDDGRVQFFSATERRLSGWNDRDRIGLDFFSRIAPCMDNPRFRGRIDQARREGSLHLEFTHIGDFNDRDRELTIRVQSASTGGYWIFLRREM